MNVTIRSADAWSRKEDGFLRQVAAGSLIPIIHRDHGDPAGRNSSSR